jgi:hypothetical protein
MFVSVIVLLGWICWLYFRRRQMLSEMKKMQLQMASSALDKFGSAGEFVAFLQSKEGKAMIYDFASPAVNRSRINMRLVQAGIILAFVGAGLFMATFLIPEMQGDTAKEVMALLIFSGTVAISMAVGLWVTAIVTVLWERRIGGSESDQV